jgi:Leucine-rich repeat (LRR) protein
LAQIASIDGSKHPWSGEPIKALAASAQLADLRWLDLSRSDISDADVEILAASPNLRKLEHIDFTRNECRNPVDAAAGYGSDENGRIVWESVHLTEFGRELEERYGRIEWLRALENFMEKHPPRRYLF